MEYEKRIYTGTAVSGQDLHLHSGKPATGRASLLRRKGTDYLCPQRKCGKMFPSAAASTMRSRHIRHSNPSGRSPAGMTLPTSGSTTTGRRWILRTLQESTSPNRGFESSPPSASTSVCSPFRTRTPMSPTSTTGAHRLPACSTATKPVRWNIRHLPASSAALYRSNGSLKLKKSTLNYFFDSDVNIMDNLLREALSHNTSPQMRSIVETIQRQQDMIIRDTQNELLFVQGVAGSGKNLGCPAQGRPFAVRRGHPKLYANNIVIISPNNLFGSYIANVLPSLGEKMLLA